MKTIRAVLLFIVSLSLCSCSKKKYTKIQLISPLENQVFATGTAVQVEAKIDDDGDLIVAEHLVVTQIDINGSSAAFEFKDNQRVSYYLLKKSFTAVSGHDYRIEVKALGGHGNWTTKTVMIKCP